MSMADRGAVFLRGGRPSPPLRSVPIARKSAGIMAKLILASSSRSRADLLRNAGVSFDQRPALIDEAAVKEAMLAEGAPARDIADTLAELKAQRVAGRVPGLVLAGDQVLVCEGRLYDKPRTAAEAGAHLRSLRGRTHELLSAAVIYEGGVPVWRHVGTARLTMRPFSDAFLADYLKEHGEDLTATVGAYRLEAGGARSDVTPQAREVAEKLTGHDYDTLWGRTAAASALAEENRTR